MRNLKYLLCAAAVYLALILAGQWGQGGWQDEFGAHADEAAHYVTGLMVRDYVADGFPGPPMRYAERYYLHYPKVALGHWPPLFYGVQLPWLLLFEPARAQLMLFMALQTLLLAFLTFALAKRLLGRPGGFLAGLLLLGFPLVRQYGSMLMADMLNALLCLAAAAYYGRFLESERKRDAMGFALLAAAAILNKGSAISLVLVPPLSLALTGRWYLLRRSAFWLPALVVLVLCAPWYWVAFPMMRNGFENPQGLASSLRAVLFYSGGLLRYFGPVLLFLAGWGAVAGLRSGRRPGWWAALTALALAVPLFHCLVTNAYDGRYLLPVFPVLLILILNGARRVLVLCRNKRGPWPARLLVAMSLALLLVGRFAVPPRLLGGSGFGMPAADLLADSTADGQSWLVSSDARGEGMFIAQVALREQRRPTHFALRASKMLADSLWDGRDYRPRFAAPADLRDYLLAAPVGVILTDTTIPSERRMPHHALLERTLRDFPDDFNLINSYPLTRDGIFHPRGLLVYRVVGRTAMPQLDLEVSLERMLRRRVSDK